MSSHQQKAYTLDAVSDLGTWIHQRLSWAWIVLAMVCVLNGLAHAKVAAGVSGIVTDASGAVVAGATVQMKIIEPESSRPGKATPKGFMHL